MVRVTREDAGRAMGAGLVAVSRWFARGFWMALGIELAVFVGRRLGWL